MIPLLLTAALLAPPDTIEPISPEAEVLLIETIWDPTLCSDVREVYEILLPAVGDHDIAVDFVTAYSVEKMEEGYGRNFMEPAEEWLVETIEECI